MRQEDRLLSRLKMYSETDYYPFHMPGHKRCYQAGEEYINPFQIDITEIEGFDNLHRPEGILRESMEWAASLYGADKTYYLINGSSCGLLSAICASTARGGKILLCRNSHKAAYNGVFLNQLQAEYVYPQILEDYGIQGGVLVADVERKLRQDQEIEAVLVVSPTYDGIVSDIAAIARAAHERGIPLIVDEAHGAHFAFGEGFPTSALKLGADVVIQSLHKTLPSLTQTAVLHVRKGFVDTEEIERYLRVFQSSSPSYVLLASIENCIYQMDRAGRKELDRLSGMLTCTRERLSAMKHLRLAGSEIIGSNGVFDMDLSKIVVTARNTQINGAQLGRILRERYHLDMEMCGAEHVVAVTTVADREEGFRRLEKALAEIDGELKTRDWKIDEEDDLEWSRKITSRPEVEMTIFEGITSPKLSVTWEESIGRISGEFVYIYPPGIPIVAPGEMLLPSLVHTILEYQEIGLPVQGPEDENGECVQVVNK